MKTYNLQKRAATEHSTDIYNIGTFNDLETAKKEFENVLKTQDTYAGEYKRDFKEYYLEILEIESFDYETEDFGSEIEITVYHEGVFDKNNWFGDYPVNYWGIAKHDGEKLIYNFYDNSKDLNLEYENITDLNNWYNYKR